MGLDACAASNESTGCRLAGGLMSRLFALRSGQVSDSVRQRQASASKKVRVIVLVFHLQK